MFHNVLKRFHDMNEIKKMELSCWFMKVFHMDKETGVPFVCSLHDHDTCTGISYGSAQEAIHDFLWVLENNVFLNNIHDDVVEKFMPCVVSKGFCRAFEWYSRDDILAHVSILYSRFLDVSQIFDTNIQHTGYSSDAIHGALNFLFRHYSDVQALEAMDFTVLPEDFLKVLLAVSASLWIPVQSPLHGYAKAVYNATTMFSVEDRNSFYCSRNRSSRNKTTVNNVLCMSSHEAIMCLLSLSDTAATNILQAECLNNKMFYDIEMDTSDGLGLVPRKSQITHMSLVSKHESFVFSGDESFVLKSFFETVENLRNESFNTLLGWNNHSFDDIATATRCELRCIESPQLKLYEVESLTKYGSHAVSDKPHAMEIIFDPHIVNKDRNCRDDNNMIITKDVLFMWCENNRKNKNQSIVDYTGDVVGLKDFVSTLGARPLRENAALLHCVDDENIQKYVLSDAVSTMVAFHGLCTR